MWPSTAAAGVPCAQKVGIRRNLAPAGGWQWPPGISGARVRRRPQLSSAMFPRRCKPMNPMCRGRFPHPFRGCCCLGMPGQIVLAAFSTGDYDTPGIFCSACGGDRSSYRGGEDADAATSSTRTPDAEAPNLEPPAVGLSSQATPVYNTCVREFDISI